MNKIESCEIRGILWLIASILAFSNDYMFTGYATSLCSLLMITSSILTATVGGGK